jgi:hypothetical protein
MNKLIPSTQLQRKPDLIFGNIDEEVVIFDIDKDSFIHMNSVASRIFELIENPMSLEQLHKQMMSEYEIDADTCEQEVSNTVLDLEQRGLLVSSSKK